MKSATAEVTITIPVRMTGVTEATYGQLATADFKCAGGTFSLDVSDETYRTLAGCVSARTELRIIAAYEPAIEGERIDSERVCGSSHEEAPTPSAPHATIGAHMARMEFGSAIYHVLVVPSDDDARLLSGSLRDGKLTFCAEDGR